MERMIESKETPTADAIVPITVALLQAQHPGEDIVGVCITYVAVEHGPDENHTDCTIIARHCGGTASENRDLIDHLAKAVKDSGRVLAEKVAKMPPGAANTEVGH